MRDTTEFVDQVLTDFHDAMHQPIGDAVTVVEALRRVDGRSQEEAAALADRLVRMGRMCVCGMRYGEHGARTQECPKNAPLWGGPGSRYRPSEPETSGELLKRRLREYQEGV